MSTTRWDRFQDVNRSRLPLCCLLTWLFLSCGCSQLPGLVAATPAGAQADDTSALRAKYGVKQGEPDSELELLNQIFADDDVDPFTRQSLDLKALAISPKALARAPAGNAELPTALDQQARFDTAIALLRKSQTFEKFYISELEPLLKLAQTSINFNRNGTNCGGPVTRGPFHDEIIGIALHLDLQTPLPILTTRGIQLAVPERIIAHELFESTDCNCQGSSLSKPDEGLMKMTTVLRVNQVIRELRQQGLLPEAVSAARIRYWR